MGLSWQQAPRSRREVPFAACWRLASGIGLGAAYAGRRRPPACTLGRCDCALSELLLPRRPATSRNRGRHEMSHAPGILP